MIKMLRGVFGLPEKGIVKRKDKNSEPFNAGAEQEARLVSLGLAEYVDDTVVDDAPIGFDEIPEYSIENTATELREIAKMCGLTFKVGMTKAAMVEALDKFFEKNLVDDAEDTDNDTVVDDAPTFDASEAVQ